MTVPAIQTIELFKQTEGAISVAEGIAIYNVTQSAPRGCFVELGSHEGKAAIMASASSGIHRIFHLVDPCYDVNNAEAWANSCQGTVEKAWHKVHNKDFNSNVENRIIKASDGMVAPHLMGDYSTHALKLVEEEIAYCMVDSDQHQYELAHEECNLLRDKMAIGGIIGFHDFKSQFHGVERAYREMLDGGRYEEVPIDWEEAIKIADYFGGEDGNRSWHHNELKHPCFFGAIRRIK